jgi:hypothetical protein
MKKWSFLAAAALCMGVNPLPYQLRKPDKPFKACSLPDCHKTTNHNGGYCCASHCKEHRRLLKIERQNAKQ